MTASDITPAVSVCVVTYNQDKYIRECLQSVMNQRTSFPFEVIVGDDCSSDQTRAIVEDFERKYPGTVRGLFHGARNGAVRNCYLTYALARAPLIAHLDGDDLMLAGKLQKQHDFLARHPDCAFVAHKTFVISESGDSICGVLPISDRPENSTLEDLVRSYIYFAHSSKMFRREAHVHRTMDEAIDDVIDFTWHIEHARSGDIGFINEVLGEYRRGAIGSLTGATGGEGLMWRLRATLRAYDRALALGVDPAVVSAGRARYLFGAAMYHAQLRQYPAMLQRLRECEQCHSANELMTRMAGTLARLPLLAKVVLHAGLILRDFKHRSRVRPRI